MFIEKKLATALNAMLDNIHKEENRLQTDLLKFEETLLIDDIDRLERESCESSRRIYMGVILIYELADTYIDEKQRISFEVINEEFCHRIEVVFQKCLERVSKEPYRRNIIARQSEIRAILPKLISFCENSSFAGCCN